MTDVAQTDMTGAELTGASVSDTSWLHQLSAMNVIGSRHIQERYVVRHSSSSTRLVLEVLTR
jgi:hypothetical protein